MLGSAIDIKSIETGSQLVNSLRGLKGMSYSEPGEGDGILRLTEEQKLEWADGDGIALDERITEFLTLVSGELYFMLLSGKSYAFYEVYGSNLTEVNAEKVGSLASGAESWDDFSKVVQKNTLAYIDSGTAVDMLRVSTSADNARKNLVEEDEDGTKKLPTDSSERIRENIRESGGIGGAEGNVTARKGSLSGLSSIDEASSQVIGEPIALDEYIVLSDKSGRGLAIHDARIDGDASISYPTQGGESEAIDGMVSVLPGHLYIGKNNSCMILYRERERGPFDIQVWSRAADTLVNGVRSDDEARSVLECLSRGVYSNPEEIEMAFDKAGLENADARKASGKSIGDMV